MDDLFGAPPAALIATIKSEARHGSLTDEDLDAELAAYKAGGRIGELPTNGSPRRSMIA